MTALEALQEVRQWIKEEAEAIESERDSPDNDSLTFTTLCNGELTSLMSIDSYILYVIEKELRQDGNH